MEDNEKWSKERKALKKIQYHFTLSSKVDRALRHDAVDHDMTPSNVFRKVIGLGHAVSRRPRIGMHLSEDDIRSLSEKYGVDPNNKDELKRRAREEVQLYYRDIERDQQ